VSNQSHPWRDRIRPEDPVNQASPGKVGNFGADSALCQDGGWKAWLRSCFCGVLDCDPVKIPLAGD